MVGDTRFAGTLEGLFDLRLSCPPQDYLSAVTCILYMTHVSKHTFLNRSLPMFFHYDRLKLLELCSKVISLAAGMSTHHGVVPQNPQTPQNTPKKNIRITEESSVPRVPLGWDNLRKID